MSSRLASFIILTVLSSTCLSLDLSQQSFGQGLYGGLGISHSNIYIDEFDIDKQVKDDDDTSLALKAFIGYRFDQHWGLELGHKSYETLEFKPQRDAVSRYEVELDRRDTYLTQTFEIRPKGFIPIRFGLGLSHSDLEFTVQESFFGFAPSGKASDDDSGTGLYATIGLKPFTLKRVSSVISFEYIKREKLFKGSNNAISSEEWSVGFAALFH